MNYFDSAIIAVLGGLIPCFLWLMFWLREDKAHPEPKHRIIEAFSGGILCTLLALPLEAIVSKIFGSHPSLPLYFMWASIEELLKFGACYFVALRSIDNDEPIDAVIYMIITALGFSALENSLFIFNPILLNNGFDALITGNLRFVGASLLHVLTSSLVGIFIAFSFYKPKLLKKINILMGLFFAIVIHTFFNFIIADKTTGGSIVLVFSAVWWGIIAVIVMFEKIKLLHPYFVTLHNSALMEIDPRVE